MNITFNTYAEQLQFEVNALKRVSSENEFTQYLFSVENRITMYPNLVLDLRKELIANYRVYAQRMISQNVPIPSNYMEACYPGMEPPAVLEQAPVQQVAPQPMPVQQVAPQPVPVQQVAPQPVPVQQVAPQPVPVQQVAPQPVPVQQAAPQPAPVQQAAEPRRKNGFEFAIGGIVLSVLGVVLILFGFIMLAMNFFDSMWQGICLYAVCAAVFAFSEFLVKKVVPKLSYVLTSFSFAGLFVVTMVNYFALDLFNFWIALIVLLIITIVIAVFSYFRKSFLFALIGYVSTFVVLGLIGEVESALQLYSLFGALIVVQFFWIAFPVKKNGFALTIVELVGTLVYSIAIDRWGDVITWDDSSLTVACVMLSLAFISECLIIFISAFKYFSKEAERKAGDIGRSIPISVLLGFFAVAYYSFILDIGFDEVSNIVMLICFVMVLVPSVLGAVVLKKKGCMFWQQLLYAGAIFSMAPTNAIESDVLNAILLALVCLAVFAFTKFDKSTSVKILDLIMKAYLVVVTVVFAYALDCDPTVFILLACVVAALGLCSGFMVASEIILTGALTWTICVITPSSTWLMIMSGILVAAIFVFHNVKWFKSKHILVFDIFALVEFVFILGFLNHYIYRNEMISMLVVFVFGIGILLQYMQKSYKMFFAGSIMPLAIYLSYFVLVLRIDEAVVTSAILIVVALICVALGFLMKQKAVRIFGLVLAMLVCCKLVFYDFWDAASLVKTIMYFVVGILVLVIAGVYIVVEMLMAKKAAKEVEQKNVQ